jgi:hypothetical protein
MTTAHTVKTRTAGEDDATIEVRTDDSLTGRTEDCTTRYHVTVTLLLY